MSKPKGKKSSTDATTVKRHRSKKKYTSSIDAARARIKQIMTIVGRLEKERKTYPPDKPFKRVTQINDLLAAYDEEMKELGEKVGYKGDRRA